MIEGRCPKCGYRFVGWALLFPRNQMCSNCGAALQIYQDGKRVPGGYSPFTAEKHTVNLPSSARSTPESGEKAKHTEDTRHKS
jgi:ribosomal protein S27AE